MESQFVPEQEVHTPALKEQWLDAALEGNLRLPQTGLGVGILLGYELLRDPMTDYEKFMEARPSTEQVEKIQRHLERSHGAHGVSADRTEEIMSRGAQLWNHDRFSALFYLPRIANCITEKPQFRGRLDYGEIATKLNELFQNPVIYEQAVAVVAALAQGLRSDTLLRLSQEYRDLFRPDPEKSEDEQLHLQIQKRLEIRSALISYIQEHYPELPMPDLPV